VNHSETFFLSTRAEARDLREAFGLPRIGITIDTFHANIEEKNISTAIKNAGRRLEPIHISENDPGLIGSGHVDFETIFNSLKAIDYEGCLLIEGYGYSPQEQDSPGALWATLRLPAHHAHGKRFKS
jgi:D-psicose/D-tagatose/L-ribulose 3-epimerase